MEENLNSTASLTNNTSNVSELHGNVTNVTVTDENNLSELARLMYLAKLARLIHLVEIARLINVYGRPPIIVLGTLGNVLAFIVMRRGSMRHVSTCFYMAILALADMGVLWTAGFPLWLWHLTRGNVDINAIMHCKLNYTLSYFCLHYSSSFLVIMSVEKLFALYFPLRTKSICTVSTAKKLTFASAVVLVIYDGQYLVILSQKTTENGVKYCIMVNIPDGYPAIYWQIHSILYSFAPFTIMITANCMIIFKFMLAKWQNRRGGTESVSQALSKSAVKGTVMLVTVSTVFIILTGPIAIGLAVYGDHIPRIMQGSLVLLQYLNHSINAVLYCITGSRFRNELMKVLGCYKQKRRSTTSIATRSRSMATTSMHMATNSTSMSDEASTGSPI